MSSLTWCLPIPIAEFTTLPESRTDLIKKLHLDKLVEGEEFVKANELVEEINESRGGSPTPSKGGTYKIFSPKQRYEIGKYASEHGNARAHRGHKNERCNTTTLYYNSNNSAMFLARENKNYKTYL
jgi:hypothetical protein